MGALGHTSRLAAMGAAETGKGAIKAGWNAAKSIARGAAEQVKALPSGVTARGTKDLIGSSIHYLRGADRTFFNKTEHSLSNIFGRQPKPWFLGSLALVAIGGGTAIGTNMYDSSHAEPQMSSTGGTGTIPEQTLPVRPGQINALSGDGSYNIPEDYGTTGLVQAMHKNRHG
jgi:hypothetical protein